MTKHDQRVLDRFFHLQIFILDRLTLASPSIRQTFLDDSGKPFSWPFVEIR